jgi:hypothetical protein
MGSETRPSIEKVEDSQSSEKGHEAAHRTPMTPEEKKLALEAALAVDPGASRWGFRAFQAGSYYLSVNILLTFTPDVPHYPRRLLLLR